LFPEIKAMRIHITPAVALFFALNASASTLKVEVNRNGFAGPVDVAIATRVEGAPPEWSATRTLASGKSTIELSGLQAGLYIVMLRGPQPLQRLSATANLGAEGSTIQFVIPRSTTTLRVTLAGRPLARAAVSLTHDALRWTTELAMGEDGRFEGELWEPGVYTARVQRDRAAAPHIADVTLSPRPLTIDVPDRGITGRVIDDDGNPIAGAEVTLRSESGHSTLTVRTQSAPDGRYEFFGVREGTHTVSARAPSYLISDPVELELRGGPTHHQADLKLTRGMQRAVRVVDGRGAGLGNATILTACEGHVKSTSVTDEEGWAHVALPDSGSCVLYAFPREGSIGMARLTGTGNLVIRVPAGSSSLRLTLKSEGGEVFSGLPLLMRVDGVVIPPAIARQLANRGFPLVTDEDGSISLVHIPPGTYEFWPYRTEAEGQMIYEVAAEIAAPIAVNVVTGENNATVRFKARR
jgi:hypothetical protein